MKKNLLKFHPLTEGEEAYQSTLFIENDGKIVIFKVMVREGLDLAKYFYERSLRRLVIIIKSYF